jgi:hypothetical protein
MLYLQVFSMLWAPLLGYAQVVLDSAPAIDTVRGNDILKYVDPLIGSTNGGHVFAGAVSRSNHSYCSRSVLILPVSALWYVYSV